MIIDAIKVCCHRIHAYPATPRFVISESLLFLMFTIAIVFAEFMHSLPNECFSTCKPRQHMIVVSVRLLLAVARLLGWR